MECMECGNHISSQEKKYKLVGKVLCEKCFKKEQERGNVCPCCKATIPAGQNEVGLVLTLANSGPFTKATAPQALAIICPNCHVLFFDDFTYKTLESLKLVKETI